MHVLHSAVSSGGIEILKVLMSHPYKTDLLQVREYLAEFTSHLSNSGSSVAKYQILFLLKVSLEFITRNSSFILIFRAGFVPPFLWRYDLGSACLVICLLTVLFSIWMIFHRYYKVFQHLKLLAFMGNVGIRKAPFWIIWLAELLGVSNGMSSECWLVRAFIHLRLWLIRQYSGLNFT